MTVGGSTRVLAVDLGATSVRVAEIDLGALAPEPLVLHRWRHTPVHDAEGSLRWDWEGIVAHVEHGLTLGMERGPVASIGVDGWGVDYGLIDATGNLVDAPYAYRDHRTDGWNTTAQHLGIERLYGITGVQLMGINTIFQLAADTRERLDRADRMLLLPDLLTNHLSGWVGCERSNMSTTGLMDARSRDWSVDLIDELGLPATLFPDAADAGARAGDWNGVPVHLVGSHDTASAFLGSPLRAGEHSVFVSAGSWVIAGVERDAPDTSDRARALNFSNEAGALGGIRFLKNVVGFWILEECRGSWGNPSVPDLVAEAAQVDGTVPRFDASDHRFVGAEDMLAEVLDAASLPRDTPRPIIVRSILESIVDGVARVVDEIRTVTDAKPVRIVLVGGGARIDLFADLLGRRTGLDIGIGSPEATALGNAVVQGIAVGAFADLAVARDWVSSGAPSTEPR